MDDTRTEPTKRFYFLKIGLLVLIIAAVAAEVSQRFRAYSESKQEAGAYFANEKANDLHILVLSPRLKMDARFSKIELGNTSHNNCSLLVSGHVSSDEDLEALKLLIEESHPPTRPRYYVEILPPEVLREIERFKDVQQGEANEGKNP